MYCYIQVFTNEELGKVRVIKINDEPWFIGKDVATILGYSNSSDALKVHVDEEDKCKKDEIVIHDSIGRKQRPLLINESGLYSLILSSKLSSLSMTRFIFLKWNSLSHRFSHRI